MSAEATMRSYVDAFDRSDIDGLVGHYAPTTSYTQPFAPMPLTSPDQVRAFESGMFAGFSDVHASLEWLVAEGDRAAAGVRITAVHTSPMPTPDGSVIPATGVTIELHTAEHIRTNGDGRIVEHQRYADMAGFMAQLTAASAAATATATATA